MLNVHRSSDVQPRGWLYSSPGREKRTFKTISLKKPQMKWGVEFPTVGFRWGGCRQCVLISSIGEVGFSGSSL